MLTEIRELYEYNRWANRRVLEVTAKLSAENFSKDLRNSFPSIRQTLVHVLSAEWIWMTRWKGSSPGGIPESWNLSSHPALRTEWQNVENEQAEFVSTLTEEKLLATVAYRTTLGESYSNPLWQLMRHVVNHSTYHRGQITTMLRQLGADAIGTDLIYFYRERSK
jgi:uncharacterized damage-inducible protein DinB